MSAAMHERVRELSCHSGWGGSVPIDMLGCYHNQKKMKIGRNSSAVRPGLRDPSLRRARPDKLRFRAKGPVET